MKKGVRHSLYSVIKLPIFSRPSCSHQISPFIQCLILLLEIFFHCLKSHKSLPQIWNMHMIYMLIKVFMEVLTKLGWLGIQVGRNINFPTCHAKCMLFKYLKTTRKQIFLLWIFLLWLHLWMIKLLLSFFRHSSLTIYMNMTCWYPLHKKHDYLGEPTRSCCHLANFIHMSTHTIN